jgi:hypothetical protein
MYFAAEVHRLAARCDRESGKTAEAREHLRTAIAIAQAQRAKLFELRAALDLADIAPRDGVMAVAGALTDFPEPEPWPDVVRALASW